MPSMFGDKFGGFRLPFTRPRPQNTPAPATPSLDVIRAQRPGLSVSTSPTANRLPESMEGWSLSPTSPLSSGSGTTPTRPGSPENYQQAFFGGNSPISPAETGPLRVMNPDPPSRSPSPPAESQAHPERQHPDSLTPGRGPAPRMALTPDLTFESPHPPRSPSPDFEFRPGERPSKIAAREISSPKTFAEMGFVNVQKRTLWYNPSTWGKQETRAIFQDQVNPRKHKLLTTPPPDASSPTETSRRPIPLRAAPRPEAFRPTPTDAHNPSSTLADAREALRAKGRNIPEPQHGSVMGNPKLIGEGIQRPSGPSPDNRRNRL